MNHSTHETQDRILGGFQTIRLAVCAAAQSGMTEHEIMDLVRRIIQERQTNADLIGGYPHDRQCH